MSLTPKAQWAHRAASASLIGLIALCVAWELSLAPLRPEGSWLVLKVIPLLLVLPGILKQRVRTFQVTSLLIWIYFAEGATRASSDPALESRLLAGLEVALCLLLFTAVSVYARAFKIPKVKAEPTAGQ